MPTTIFRKRNTAANKTSLVPSTIELAFRGNRWKIDFIMS